MFLLLAKIKALPSLEAQKDMVKWVLQVGPLSHISLKISYQVFLLIYFSITVTIVYVILFLLDV